MLTVRINSFGDAWAIKGLTAVHFDLSQSVGAGLTYRLLYGDKKSDTSVEATSFHVYDSPGVFHVVGIVTDQWGRSDIQAASVLVSTLQTQVTSSWLEGGPEVRRLDVHTHDGRRIEGTYSQVSAWSLRFHGVLSGERTLTLSLEDGRVLVGPVIFDNERPRLELKVDVGPETGQIKVFRYYEQYLRSAAPQEPRLCRSNRAVPSWPFC